jgi:ribosomal protein S18 acetylase RimI-like enzyme
MVPAEGIEWRRVSPELEAPLAEFFKGLSAEGQHHFHPHPFDEVQARRIASYGGKDLYYVLIEGAVVLAYGMLRGWDEGFAIPSLGIVVGSSFRGLGLARTVMNLLRLAAQRRGAKKIRLKVYEENTRAVSLYRSLGYDLATREGEQLVGFLDLE